MSGDARLSAKAKRVLATEKNELLLSPVSSWEISIKYALGKLKLPGDPESSFARWLAETGVTGIPLLHAHALRAGSLPLHHRDPFDRMLIAQAQLEGVPIMTSDPLYAAYDVKLLAA